ncbi:hypothetical protein ACUN0C_01645 [Faunimonas sp. B44]|uniref:hypothetical protein n=1 Tax=Faunimonas sp. B44 TaxID=3461493 RepID=UPI004044D546
MAKQTRGRSGSSRSRGSRPPVIIDLDAQDVSRSAGSAPGAEEPVPPAEDQATAGAPTSETVAEGGFVPPAAPPADEPTVEAPPVEAQSGEPAASAEPESETALNAEPEPAASAEAVPASPAEQARDEAEPGDQIATPSDAVLAGAGTADVPPEEPAASAEGLRSDADEIGPDSDLAAAAGPGEPREAGLTAESAEDVHRPVASEMPPPPRAPAEAAPRRGAPSFLSLLAAALLGAAAALGGAWLLERSGTDLTGQREEIAGLRQDIAELRAQSAAQSETIAQPQTEGLEEIRSEIAGLQNAVGQLRDAPAGDPALAGQLQDLAGRLDQLQAEAQQAPTAAAAPDLEPQIADLRTALDELRAEVGGAAAGAALDELRGETGGLGERIAALENRPPVDLSGLQSAIEDLRGELRQATERDGALQSGLDALQSDLDGVKAQIGGLAQADRLTALETELGGFRDEARRAGALAPALAADLLASALESGRPFASELEAARNAGVVDAADEAVSQQAAEGLPTADELRRSFEAVAADLTRPEEPPSDAGPLDRILAGARRVVQVRPAEPVEGDDPQATVSRIRDALQRDDAGTALEEWRTLPEDARSASAEWAASLEARVHGLALAERLRSDILTRLGGSAG